MTKVVQEWRVTENGNLICSEDFTFDAMLKLDGDFADDAQRIQYAEAIASKLNSTLESARSEALDLHRFVNAADIGGADSPHVVVEKLQAAINRVHSPARVAEGGVVPEGESRWLIERTYAKGQPAERREFWLGTTPGDMHRDSFYSNNEVWTTNPLEAARFSSQKIAETLRYRHFHPEAPVEACEHMFQCGISPESPAKEQPEEQNEAGGHHE